jgi:hypothetical protein
MKRGDGLLAVFGGRFTGPILKPATQKVEREDVRGVVGLIEG